MAKIHYGVKTSRKQGGPKMAKIQYGVKPDLDPLFPGSIIQQVLQVLCFLGLFWDPVTNIPTHFSIFFNFNHGYLLFSISLSTHQLVSNKPPSHRFPLSLRTRHTLKKLRPCSAQAFLRASTKPPAQRRSLTSVLYPVPHVLQFTVKKTENVHHTNNALTQQSPHGNLHWSLPFKKWQHCARIQLCIFALFSGGAFL